MTTGRGRDAGRVAEPRGSFARYRAPCVGLAIVIASVALVGCGVQAGGYEPQVKGPGLRLEPASIDVGRIRQTEKVQGTTTIRNVGDAVLVINEITTH